MSISETDIKLLKSEQLSDFAEGGGRMTIDPVTDGELNNLFDDISGLDRAYGRVSLRKSYLSIQAATTDRYLGAHVILTNAPADTDVSVLMFSTDSWTDTRAAARNRVESYMTLGAALEWVLMGTHASGQKILQLFSIANASTINSTIPASAPDIGDVIALSVGLGGSDPVQQFVKVTAIRSRDIQAFYDTAEFFKDILVLEISDPLGQDFFGIDPTRASKTGCPTEVRSTLVTDTAQYYGVKAISEPLTANDVVVNVGSPYERLVPSNTAESPLVDVPVNSVHANYIQASATNDLTATINMGSSEPPNYVDFLYLGRGILPGSLVLTIDGSAYKDNKQGALVLANGNIGAYTGVVDYASGGIQIIGAAAWSETVAAVATQAVVTYDNAATDALDVTINNRAFNWVMTLRPIPTPGTLVVDYRALNKWYRLYDDGDGHLTGKGVSIGTGTVNYATGSVLMTLAALPDVNTQILFSWAVPADYTRQTYSGAPPIAEVRMTLANTPIVPGSLVITWQQNGVNKTASAATDGTVTGDATGRLVAATGDLRIKPTVLPASGTTFTLNYEQSELVNDTFSLSGNEAGQVTLTLAETPVKPGSVTIAYKVSEKKNQIDFLNTQDQTTTTTTGFIDAAVTDDADGHIIDKDGNTVGSIVYSTGAVLFTAVNTYSYLKTVGVAGAGGGGGNGSGLALFVAGRTTFNKSHIETTSQLPGGTSFDCRYTLDSAASTAKTESAALTQVKVDLSPATNEELVAGSLRFVYAGSVFIDRGGVLYRSQNRLNDAAVAAGTINYQTGLATLTSWTGGSTALTIKSAVTIRGTALAVTMFGRTPGAPLAIGQFQLVVTAFDGVEMIANADNDGNITAVSGLVQGTVNWQTGVYQLAFGKTVPVSSLSDAQKLQGWYDPLKADGQGNIFVPLPVKTETATFNTVLVSYLPLDADILGINAVRLPSDGRVPIFRVGNMVVVHNTQTYALPNPAVASHTYDVGRTRLSYARLYDYNRLAVPATEYTADLNAGTVTIAPDPVFTGFVQPFHIEHRAEDMRLVTDVQISGQITLHRTLSHAYPANTSFISSALIVGDMQARVPVGFEQSAWGGVWGDVRSGNAPLAQFNSLLFPIVVTNQGAIMERWVIVFTSPTAFSCYGESYGLIAIGTVNDNFAPVNPLTQYPYFSINPAAWGLGWSTGNCYRFNTVSANYPLWIARTTQQSEPATFTDNFQIQIRGDSN